MQDKQLSLNPEIFKIYILPGSGIIWKVPNGWLSSLNVCPGLVL
jgi:hypothetical protein